MMAAGRVSLLADGEVGVSKPLVSIASTAPSIVSAPQPVFDAADPLAYFKTATPFFTYAYEAASSWLQGGGDSEGPTRVDSPAFIKASNGRALELGADSTFTDTFDRPGGAGEREKVAVTYRYDQATGKSTPIAAREFFQGSDWTTQWRTPVAILGAVLAAGAGGYALAGVEAGSGAAVGGLSGMDLAADAAIGTGNNIFTAGSVFGAAAPAVAPAVAEASVGSGAWAPSTTAATAAPVAAGAGSSLGSIGSAVASGAGSLLNTIGKALPIVAALTGAAAQQSNASNLAAQQQAVASAAQQRQRSLLLLAAGAVGVFFLARK